MEQERAKTAATQRTVRLLKNHIYPTYQLHAMMANRKTAPKDGLRLGALLAMDWLRKRLGDELPQELQDIPDAEHYHEIENEKLPSLHVNRGFVIDIVSLPKKGVWSLQITEPDLGSDPGNPEQRRAAVAGRIIETDVAFRINGPRLECGFQTLISDPEGTAEQAEVYRLALVHGLIRCPEFGLEQVIPLDYGVREVDSARQLATLMNLWRDSGNQLPCVIFTKAVPLWDSAVIQPVMPLPGMRAVNRQAGLLPSGFPAAPPRPAPEPVQPYDIRKFAQGGVTFCHTFQLTNSMLEKFSAQAQLELRPGDIAVLEPRRFGGQVRVLSYKPNKTRQEEIMDVLKQEIYSYPRNREVSFGNITFLSAAREDLLYSTETVLRQSKARSEEWEQELERLRLQWQAQLRRKDEEKQEALDRLERQRAYTDRVEQEKRALERRHAQELDKLRDEAARKDEQITYLRRRLAQPRSHSEIADWVRTYFPDRLILHAKAAKLLESREAQNTDIGMICDALDFLATDYWECRYARLPENMMHSRCSAKYGRPFNLVPTGDTSINMFPDQYKVSYGISPEGKPVDVPLEYHLKSGNKAENLLRVYFFHDDGRQLIVVGSLPRHLRTATIS